jgi:hypothetical protein
MGLSECYIQFLVDVPPGFFQRFMTASYDMIDVICDMIWYDMTYLLTAVGLSPGGSTHLHTNNT